MQHALCKLSNGVEYNIYGVFLVVILYYFLNGVEVRALA